MNIETEREAQNMRSMIWGVKRHHMKTTIVYEDNDIIVCHKPAGIAVQTASSMQQDVVSELKNYLASKGQKNPYVGVVHRLDQPVSGIVVFGKNQKATASLSAQVQDGRAEKIYRALVYGSFPKKEGILEDILIKDAKSNSSKVITPGSADAKNGKKAKLFYRVLREIPIGSEAYSELEIKLDTGRHHQIRVQMAHAGHPVLSDTKYGTDASLTFSKQIKGSLKLCAYCLTIVHPQTGKKRTFQTPQLPWA